MGNVAIKVLMALFTEVFYLVQLDSKYYTINIWVCFIKADNINVSPFLVRFILSFPIIPQINSRVFWIDHPVHYDLFSALYSFDYSSTGNTKRQSCHRRERNNFPPFLTNSFPEKYDKWETWRLEVSFPPKASKESADLGFGGSVWERPKNKGSIIDV